MATGSRRHVRGCAMSAVCSVARTRPSVSLSVMTLLFYVTVASISSIRYWPRHNGTYSQGVCPHTQEANSVHLQGHLTDLEPIETCEVFFSDGEQEALSDWHQLQVVVVWLCLQEGQEQVGTGWGHRRRMTYL